LAAVVAAVTLLGGGVALAATALREPWDSGPDRTAQQPPQGPNDFESYYLGRTFERLPLVARMRRLDDRAARGEFRANYLSFLYGKCKADGDAGCQPPLEAQNWAACERNLSTYRLTPRGDPVPRKTLTVRGVPAALFEDGFRLEIYTGKTTVVIFGTDASRIRRAGEALRSVDGTVGPQDRLPPPVPGAVQGALKCAD
jgi:hypothetical protein